MYASCWILTKIENLTPRDSLSSDSRNGSMDLEKLEISLLDAALDPSLPPAFTHPQEINRE